MKQKVKELRVQIDGLAQLTEGLKSLDNCIIIDERVGINRNSKQINKATDSLFLAKEWLGKVLGALGTESPYPKDGTRKTVKDIEPTADVSEASKKGWEEGFSHIEKVDWLRQEISKVVKELETPLFTSFYSMQHKEATKKVDEKYPRGEVHDFDKMGKEYKSIFDSLIDIDYEVMHSIQHLSEARFWLGFELERIGKETTKG